jgi:hypothetical protein
VSALSRWPHFTVLTTPSLCTGQSVNVPRSLNLSCRPDASPALFSTARECQSPTGLALLSWQFLALCSIVREYGVPLARWAYFSVLTGPSLCTRQVVSAPHSMVCVPRFPEDFLTLCSTECECYMLTDFPSLLWRHSCARQFISATNVSSPLLLTLSLFPDSLCPQEDVSPPRLRPTVGECSSLTDFSCSDDTLGLHSQDSPPHLHIASNASAFSYVLRLAPLPDSMSSLLLNTWSWCRRISIIKMILNYLVWCDTIWNMMRTIKSLCFYCLTL